MSDTRANLTEYLATMRALDDHYKSCQQCEPRAHSSCLDSWLAAKGAFMEGERLKLPDHQVMPQSRQCYLNAWRYILRRQRGNAALRRGLQYCEGLVAIECCPIPVWHGWVIDKDGRIIDPSVEHGRECSYFGVAFESKMVEQLWARLYKEQRIGIIGNLWVFDWHVHDLEPYIYVPQKEAA